MGIQSNARSSLMPPHGGNSIEWHLVDTRPGHSGLD